MNCRFMREKVGVKIHCLTLHSKKCGSIDSLDPLLPRSMALQSWKWQLIGKSQWCGGAALCGAAYLLPALTDIGAVAAASKRVSE